ncbi:WYL domain-containing protein [Cryobacterium melibiosiphilum]|uniref:WYL domain-containing protein n=1 Tax=Cryobacterium melibiosiphilum TaxID=995039 RepID=A0A3A5MTG9_9MICO|nr:WYL domain-containing protein [Cryobacterium melibiosiphilum]RJT89256.1 WYL domain-containing protein [Cryobacterium melibiosiphilum]
MPGALRGPDRLAFLLALVPYLQDHDTVSVTDVAAHFDVTPERVRDAVTLIAVSGVPGATNQYQHGDLFDIQWDEFELNDRIVLTHLVGIDDAPRFSAREAAALIAGLQYLSALPENADRAAIASLMAKLTRGASAPPTQLLAEKSGSADALALIATAVQADVQVEFDYLNGAGEHEHRFVDPLRVESVDRDWYLRGWCHLRSAVRTFRLDRLVDLRVTDRPRTGQPVSALPDRLFEPSAEDLTVVVELPESALPLLADYRPERVTDKVHTEKVDGDRCRVRLRLASFHGLKRLVTGLPGTVTVIAPGEARRVVADWAAAAAAQYETPAAPTERA